MSLLANPNLLEQVCRKEFRQYQKNGEVDRQDLKNAVGAVCEQTQVGHCSEKLLVMAMAEMGKDSRFMEDDFYRLFSIYLRNLSAGQPQELDMCDFVEYRAKQSK
eukprot:g19117.t1